MNTPRLPVRPLLAAVVTALLAGLIAPLELRSSADPNAYGNAIAEYEQFYGLGVDGLFADNPDTAVEAR